MPVVKKRAWQGLIDKYLPALKREPASFPGAPPWVRLCPQWLASREMVALLLWDTPPHNKICQTFIETPVPAYPSRLFGINVDNGWEDREDVIITDRTAPAWAEMHHAFPLTAHFVFDETGDILYASDGDLYTILGIHRRRVDSATLLTAIEEFRKYGEQVDGKLGQQLAVMTAEYEPLI